jgi:hypothetical protein
MIEISLEKYVQMFITLDSWLVSYPIELTLNQVRIL